MMKSTTSIIASLLACVVVALPRALENGDPLPETSRVTAFLVSKDGTPSIECWEISSLVETYQVQRTDGTSATAQALSFASSNEFAGVEILTWPSASVLWPSTNVDAQSSFNLTDVTNMFSVQSGLIRVESIMLLGSSTSNEPEEFIFSTDNGDDWFYFEDDSSSVGSLNTKPYPFQISTISATETELLRLKFKQQPTRKVVHKGACRFNGIKTPAEPSSRASGTTRVHSPVTVQVTFDDSL